MTEAQERKYKEIREFNDDYMYWTTREDGSIVFRIVKGCNDEATWFEDYMLVLDGKGKLHKEDMYWGFIEPKKK